MRCIRVDTHTHIYIYIYIYLFFFFPFSFPFANAPSTAIGRASIYVREKTDTYKTKAKRTERHDTRNKASGCSRFGVISDITLQRSGRDTERLVVLVTESGPEVRPCVHMRVCVSPALFTISPQLTEAGDQGRGRDRLASQLAIRQWPSRT